MPLPIFNHQSNKIKTTLGIASGKGGVGKSFVTVNLAYALQKKGYRVGILDADIYGPSIKQMLPHDHAPKIESSSIEPALCNGIKMISMAHIKPEGEASAFRAPIANRYISAFLQKINWGDLDFLLIDFPPGTGDVQLTLIQQANLTAVLMITTPQEISLIDVRRAISLFNQLQIPILGIIENMSYFQCENCSNRAFPFGKGGGQRLSEETHIPLLAELPIDPVAGRHLDEGKSHFTEHSKFQTPIKEDFLYICDQIPHYLVQLENMNLQNFNQFPSDYEL